MLATLVFAAAILALPVVIVLSILAVLGAIVATLADGLANGLFRPNPS
jgi:hypothetical protein